MRKPVWLIIGVLVCLLTAAGAYFWTSQLMGSVYAYRSPLHLGPPAPGQPLGATLTRRVVFVLIDALRDDTSHQVAVMPFLNEMRGRGAWATISSRPPSYSAPGYSVLFTGAWPDLSDGPVLNLEYAEIPTWTQDDLVSAARRAGLKTAVSGYYWFEKLIPQAAVDASFYTLGEDQVADRAVVDAALPWLRAASYQFVFIHIDQVDYAGHHEGGVRDPNWDAAAQRADDLLREIVGTLDLSLDTLFVASDHGQIARGGHGGHEPITLVEPWVLVGAGVVPGEYGQVRQVDVAPTLAALLGTNIPASAQGRVQTEMLALSPAQKAAVELATVAQQGTLAQAYGLAIGRSVTVTSGGDAVEATQSAMAAALAARLRAERLPRTIVAGLLTLLPASFLFHRRGRIITWLLIGAVFNIALFHLRYAVLAGRSYSLSSVTSSDDLIAFVTMTALFAFVAGWLAFAIGLRIERSSPGFAAGLTVALALTTIYLVALPILWSYAVNGLLVTWALPDFASLFVALISGIQVLAVAVGGVILSGIAALIARLASQLRAQR